MSSMLRTETQNGSHKNTGVSAHTQTHDGLVPQVNMSAALHSLYQGLIINPAGAQGRFKRGKGLTQRQS